MTRWWFQIFFNITPYLGKIPILTSIFFRWVGSTTNQMTMAENSLRLRNHFLFLTSAPGIAGRRGQSDMAICSEPCFFQSWPFLTSWLFYIRTLNGSITVDHVVSLSQMIYPYHHIRHISISSPVSLAISIAHFISIQNIYTFEKPRYGSWTWTIFGRDRFFFLVKSRGLSGSPRTVSVFSVVGDFPHHLRIFAHFWPVF